MDTFDIAASLSFDVFCHFGYIQNIDLCSRGFYFIQVQLCIGSEVGSAVVPVRCFSAPSSLRSHVRGSPLPPAPLLNACNVDEPQKLFQTRSFMIRYIGEVHELNDCCFWKIVLNRNDLKSSGGTVPRLDDILVFKFQLMYADVAEEVDGDMDKNPELFVPDEPEWRVVSEQVLGLQGAASGVHEYFPIRFDRSYSVLLDCMIGCCVSDISIDPVNGLDSIRHCFVTATTSPEASDGSTSPITATAVELDEAARKMLVERAFDAVTVPLLCNCLVLGSTLTQLKELQEASQQLTTSAPSGSGRGAKPRLVEDWGNHPQFTETFQAELMQLQQDCRLRVISSGDVEGALDGIETFVRHCRSTAAGLVSAQASLLPRLMPQLCKRLRPRYLEAHASYWRKQVLVHICRPEYVSIPCNGEEELLQLLLDDIGKEREEALLQDMDQFARGLRLFDYRTQLEATKLPALVVQQYNAQCAIRMNGIARRGGIFAHCPSDLQVSHVSEVRIGVAWNNGDLVEEVAAQEAPIAPVVAANGSSNGSGGDIPHLIVFQHGFLGNHYDMRYLENACNSILPSSSASYSSSSASSSSPTGAVFTLSIRSNDDCSEEGIDRMAANLVDELMEYIEDSLPSFLDARSPGRLSFVGHSLGGLVVRKALEHERLRELHHRCHVYVSLATPHLGTTHLHHSSPLVATGMWAMTQWGRGTKTSLRELALSDGLLGDRTRSKVYALADNKVLSHFSRVILVSSPQDMYVPLHSTSLKFPADAVNMNGNGSSNTNGAASDSVLRTMQRNILSTIPPERLVRLTLGIAQDGPLLNLNNFIGRTAHICYLENKVVADMLIAALAPFFAPVT